MEVDHKQRRDLVVGGVEAYDLPHLTLWSTSISYDLRGLSLIIYIL